MAKINYQFDPETLSYVKVNKGFKYFLRNSVSYLGIALVLAVGLVYLVGKFYDSPEERALKDELARVKLEMGIMNKSMDQMGDVLEDIQQRDDNIYRVVFESDPIPSSIRKAGYGGANRYEYLTTLDNASLVIDTRKKMDQISKQLYIQSKSFDEVTNLARNKEKMLRSIPAIMPISNKDLKYTASGWGTRIHPIYKIQRFHYGMDFTSDIGTEVFATGDGVIKQVKSTPERDFGKWIVIDHGYGYETLYGHLSAFKVKRGQKIKRGELIGLVGNTGTSSGPHLHYEVHKDGRKVNPINFYFNDLTPGEYQEMVQISTNFGQSFD